MQKRQGTLNDIAAMVELRKKLIRLHTSDHGRSI
jgi:hypothetical protein